MQEHIINGTSKFDTEIEAKAYAETLEHAELVAWNGSSNLPNAMPKIVWRSSSLKVWNGEIWDSVNIHC